MIARSILHKLSFRCFSRNKPKNFSLVATHDNKKIEPQSNQNEGSDVQSFQDMDVSQLQSYIDEVNNPAKSKELNFELIKKLETKSAKGYLQKTGVFTKSELKELTQNKYLEVNKRRIDLEANMDPTSKIEIKVRNPEKFILPDSMKLFLFFKPKDMVCSKVDLQKQNRPTIFSYIKQIHGITEELYCIVIS